MAIYDALASEILRGSPVCVCYCVLGTRGIAMGRKEYWLNLVCILLAAEENFCDAVHDVGCEFSTRVASTCTIVTQKVNIWNE